MILGCVAAVLLGTAGAVVSGDWKSLIDKTGFSQWRTPSGKTPIEGAWENRDGVLTVKPYVHRRADLWSIDEYSDFELEWEWMAQKGANSGVKYWVQDAVTLVIVKEDVRFRRILDVSEAAPEEVTTEYSRGLEYQMADDEFEPVSIQRRDSRAGGLYSLFPPEPESVKPHGQWNKSRLVVQNGRFEHWLNGVLVASFDRAKLAAQMEKTPPNYKVVRERGPIALQYHQTVVSFRNMRIRRLD